MKLDFRWHCPLVCSVIYIISKTILLVGAGWASVLCAITVVSLKLHVLFTLCLYWKHKLKCFCGFRKAVPYFMVVVIMYLVQAPKPLALWAAEDENRPSRKHPFYPEAASNVASAFLLEYVAVLHLPWTLLSDHWSRCRIRLISWTCIFSTGCRCLSTEWCQNYCCKG